MHFNIVDIENIYCVCVYTHRHTHTFQPFCLFICLNGSLIKICKTEADRAVVERTLHLGFSLNSASNYILSLRNHSC